MNSENVLNVSNFEEFEDEEHFSLCSQVNEDFDEDFKSFDRENKEEIPIDKILINLSELHIFGFENWGKDPS